MLWSFLLSSDNISTLVNFSSHLVGLSSITQDRKCAKAALGWKMLTSQEREVTLSLSGALHALIPSHLQRYLTTRTVTQMSLLSQDCRRMNFPLQDLALKPRTAGQWSALWGLLIQGLELTTLNASSGSLVLCCKVVFGWIWFWKLRESLHQFRYVLHWSLIAGEILTCYPPFLPSTEILV